MEAARYTPWLGGRKSGGRVIDKHCRVKIRQDGHQNTGSVEGSGQLEEPSDRKMEMRKNPDV